MESPTSKQSMASANQSFSRNFEINTLFPKNDGKLLQSEFAVISQVEEEALKPVFPAFQDLNEAVGGLDTKIGNIVRRQNEDYLQEYRNEMVSVQKELMEMRRKYEEFMTRNNGEEVVDGLRKEIHQLKKDAFKHDQVLIKKDKEIQILKTKINLLEEEKRFLNEYIATSVRKNKLISIERHTRPPIVTPPLVLRRASEAKSVALDRSRAPDLSFNDDKNGIFKLSNILPEEYQDLSNMSFETGISQLDDFLNNLKNRDFTDRFRILKDIESFGKGLSVSFDRKFQESKKKILREKTKIDGFLNSKLIARSELADIFEDCVSKVRGFVEKRRLEGLKLGREGSELAIQKALEAMRSVKIEYKDFLSQDKEKLIELFVFDDTVLNVIKYLISGGKGLQTNHTSNRPSTLNAKKKQNQSMDQQHEPILGLSDLSDVSMDFQGIKDRRKHSVQPQRHGVLQPISFSSSQGSENQRDSGRDEQTRDERRSVMKKMEQLLGPEHPGLNHLRMKDVSRNYKI